MNADVKIQLFLIKLGLFDVKLGRVGKKLVTAEETEFSIRVLNSFPGSKIIYGPSVISGNLYSCLRNKSN